MKKWNKKVYVFFSLFFILSFLVYPSFSVLAYTATDEPYVPSEVEKQCFYHYAEYDSSGKPLKVRDIYYYGSKGSPAVGYLVPKNDGELYLYVANLGYLRGLEEYTYEIYSYEYYDSDGTGSYEYNRSTGAFYRQVVSADTPYSKLSKGVNMKVFNSYDSAVAYAQTGDESGLISDSSELTDSNSVYAPDIGYLQNVTFNSRNVGADNSDLDNMTYYFSYDSVTNTGFDINQDGVRVSFYSTYKGIYYDSWAKYFKKDGNVKRFDNKILQVSANGSDRLEFSYEACMQSHASEKAETEALCDSSVPTFGQIEYWLRIEQKQSDGTWRYGGWVNCSNQSTSVQGDSIADDCITQTYDGNGNLDVDGGYGSGNSTPHTYGEGSTMDSADADAIENENHKRAFESIEDFGDGLELMKVQLGNIPKVIAEVFLALPSALIVAITSGFFVCIVLRILGR